VDITRLFGGNPGLRSDDRQFVNLGLSARPFSRTDLSLSVDYSKIRTDDPIAPFPIATPEIEAAFPGRFDRDSNGRLLRIDSSPLNFRRSDQEQLRWGINFTRPLGAVPPGLQNVRTRFVGSEAELRRTAPPGATFIRAEPGSPLARRAENMSSRLFLSLYHNWTLKDAIVTRDDGPTLDLLNGDATDFRGGRRRHSVELQAGAFKRGLGARMTANWQSGTSVQGLDGAAGDLRFSDFAIVNVNLFANLADRFGGRAAPGWLKGTRATLGVTNLFNTRPRVRDQEGSVPLSYQPAYLDPLGRLITFSLRKVF
ncbi:MAG TPA: TonB-dependent receptor, partial [Sphingomonas sp.]